MHSSPVSFGTCLPPWTSRTPRHIWLARRNRSELQGEKSSRTSCSARNFARLTVCLVRCLAFWYSSLLPLFYQVFQHLQFPLTALSTDTFQHQVSVRPGVLINMYTFSTVFSKLDFSFFQTPSIPPLQASLEVVSVMKASCYSVSVRR